MWPLPALSPRPMPGPTRLAGGVMRRDAELALWALLRCLCGRSQLGRWRSHGEVAAVDGVGVRREQAARHAIAERHDRRVIAAAGRKPLRTARVEVATRWWADRGWHVAERHRLDAPALRVERRDRGEQRLGIRMRGLRKHALRAPELDDTAEIHDGDAVGKVAYHPQVVGNEEVGQFSLGFELTQEVQDLRLDRDVEGGGRFIADQQRRLDGERTRD